MKRLLIAAVLTLIICVLCSFEAIKINNAYSQYTAIKNSISADGENIAEVGNSLAEFWDKNEKPLNLFINKEALTKLKTYITSIRVYGNCNDKMQFFENLYLFDTSLYDILHSEKPNFEGLL